MDDCTNSFRAAKIPGWVSIAGLPPPPCRRTRRLDITAPERRSARPRSIVLRARPVACEPRPPHRVQPRAPRWPRKPPAFLVQGQRERLKAGLDGSDIDHSVRIAAPIAASSQFPDSFVAFSPDARFFSSDLVIQAQALRLSATD